ncbi:bacterial DNA polymerase III alpha subunit domain-containing protein [Ditylenchus destructor]|uniref:DNA-directed DNA polymerase n=1 Tax=Ditylenchus destructor TaxID=166010 RepID=A0AAD4QUS7_9BILA|nr:bacterial DNA polymerase III alpha subunit domain-containing protein [Ditylenchus destructor]
MLEGAIEPKAIAGRARELGFPAAALCDRNGLYAAMSYGDAAKKAGVQPIVGTLLCVERPDVPEGVTLRSTGWHSTRRINAATKISAISFPAHISNALFGDRLYIEIIRRLDEVEGRAEPKLLDLAYDRGIPIVATNPACYAEPDFHQAHDAMLCIAGSAYVASDERARSSPDAWMKPATEMKRLFDDLPEAIDNTLVVAQRCAYAAPKRKPILPSLARRSRGRGCAAARRRARRPRSAAGEGGITDPAKREEYFARLAFETDIIIQMGFPGYFLIVADFIKWAKQNGIPVGPGRGSGAGSVVAWALTITDLDPLELGLLFERFLNPERVFEPDFDIDFCETRRGEVIRYVQAKYGRNQMSYGQVDRLAKLVPNHPTDPWTLPRSLNGVSEFKAEYDGDEGVRHLIDLAMQLEGLPRHSSTHAAGVVIGDRPLAELTLSVLQKGVELLAARNIQIDLAALGWDDPAVYELLQRGDTVGVFQLESEGMRRTLTAVRPTNFGDIIALVSLYRPGPMDNIPMFGRRKQGLEPIEYPHPALEGILKETYGIFVYQEQVMQAAQILAGYSLGGADLLRRAMGKKIKAEMDAQRALFVEGCAKSHAAAYALLAYHTAWLKAHYPHEFYAASMCFELGQTEKLAIFVEDMKRLGVACLPPDINASEAEFSVEAVDDGFAVRYALAGLKGVGERRWNCWSRSATPKAASRALTISPAASIRACSTSVRSRRWRGQEASTASRPTGPASMPPPRRSSPSPNALTPTARAGRAACFGEAEPVGSAIQLPKSARWTLGQKIEAEKDSFGFFFSAHPLDRYQHLARLHSARTIVSLNDIDIAEGGRAGATIAALIEDARWRTSARGKRYLMATLSDASGTVPCTCFDDFTAKEMEDAARIAAAAS